jgi:hypothetical protein
MEIAGQAGGESGILGDAGILKFWNWEIGKSLSGRICVIFSNSIKTEKFSK